MIRRVPTSKSVSSKASKSNTTVQKKGGVSKTSLKSKRGGAATKVKPENKPIAESETEIQGPVIEVDSLIDVPKADPITVEIVPSEALSSQGELFAVEKENLVLKFEYNKLENKDLSARLQEIVLEVRRLNRTALQAVFEMGKYLVEARESLEETYGWGFFGKWVQEDLPFSVEMANNYINIFQLISEFPTFINTNAQSPIRVMSFIARKNVPKDVKAAAAQFAEMGQAIKAQKTAKETTQSMKDVRRFLTSQYNIQSENKELLLNAEHPITEDKQELEKLAKLSKETQGLVTVALISNPKLKVRDAISKVHEQKQLTREAEFTSTFGSEVSDERSISPQIILPQKINTQQGDWRKLLQKVEDNSIDLLLAETPMKIEWLDHYMDFFYYIDTILKPGGRALITVGHQNIYYLGEYLSTTSLKPSWTFYIRRQPGHQARIPGKQVYSATMPIAYIYKPPHKSPTSMISDLQLIDDELDPSLDSGYEKGLSYYLSKFIEAQDNKFAYLACHQNQSSFSKLVEEVLKNLELKPIESLLMLGSNS